MRDQIHEYWFRMPSLDGKRIHITDWDEVGVDSDLPPFLVAAVPKGMYDLFVESVPTQRINLGMYNATMGRWIPPPSYVEPFNPEIRQVIEGTASGSEDYLPQLRELVYKSFPDYGMEGLQPHKKRALTLGLSNELLFCLEYSMRACMTRSTFIKSCIQDSIPATIVGFESFPMEIWEEIAANTPPWNMDEQEKHPWIYHTTLGRLTLKEEEELDIKRTIGLNPETPALPVHYWVEAQSKSGVVTLDTINDITDDSYKRVFEYCDQLKLPVATCKILNNEVIETSD